MRQYELIYILEPSLDEAQLAAAVDRFKTLAESQGATIQHLERWERRRLAYEVKGRREGYYVIMNFQGSQAASAEVSRVLGITDSVLRHMTLRLDERIADRLISEARTAAEAKAAAAEEARKAAEAEAAELERQAQAAAAASAEETPRQSDEPTGDADSGEAEPA